MKRGELVTVALKGGYGKPRPALVIQSDLFDAHPSVTVMPVTSELRDTPLFRFDISPGRVNGLKHPSQVMIDKIHTVGRDRVGPVIGRLEEEQMVSVNRLMMVFLGLA
ncbi:type II toxin-antitoxin system PemK/MazF family toxin [Wenzhouxiangella sp. AB-CW3]|uniref:type II toxin-antitoxin system PemK/MazF family toxin n=1 Tax=Wenzhouxiangella sp. AB-CW3 TaxID=2771012 RepID=UPI00168B348B|nr:type II toxin-antitoxin system PemK/MazF family toxin [Wenzhouxiangella sp. AB-CW3]QOC22301.1 type II toxin-antitoxin system PemK/MazF family toxin [Wenzhouxiangella sp. AB-CW3]